MTTTLRGPGGKVIGYVIEGGSNDTGTTLILDHNQKLVAKEMSGDTWSADGRFIGKGKLGIMLLGK